MQILPQLIQIASEILVFRRVGGAPAIENSDALPTLRSSFTSGNSLFIPRDTSPV